MGNQHGNTTLPSVVTWTLQGLHPRRKYLPSVATWHNHDATPVRRIFPPGYWRVIHSASTPLGRTPEPKRGDVFVEVAKRISALVSRRILTPRDQRMFEVMGCLPGVDPMLWIKSKREDRAAAWGRWKDVHDAWQLQCSPSMATWASGTRMLPAGEPLNPAKVPAIHDYEQRDARGTRLRISRSVDSRHELGRHSRTYALMMPTREAIPELKRLPR